jgi:hypothetical protein
MNTNRNPIAKRYSIRLSVLMLIALAKAFPASAATAIVYCSDMTAVSATSGWSTVQKDKSIDQKPITLGGKIYAKGLGTHSPSEIVYNIDGKYATFSADAGIDDETAGKGTVEFAVYADDSLLFKSNVIKGQASVAKISVNVAGKNKLKLVTTIGLDTYDMDDADWGGAQLAEKTAVSIRTRGDGENKNGILVGEDAGAAGDRDFRDLRGRTIRGSEFSSLQFLRAP